MNETTMLLQENMELYAENQRLWLQVQEKEPRKKRVSPFAERNNKMAFLRNTKKWSLQEIADEYGLSRERVRQDGISATGGKRSMSKHTPLPWRFDSGDIESVTALETVAQVDYLSDDYEANAALIVEAVNNYATLRAELDAANTRIKHLETNLNAALTCATVGDTFKSLQFMAEGLLQEESKS